MKKVLVVDDDPDILKVVEVILTAYDFDVYTHPTGLDVPEIVSSYNPDLILLDIRLPGKSDPEICKELKRMDIWIPIIYFSAHEQKEKAFAICKAKDFIQKPFDVKDLISRIKLYTD